MNPYITANIIKHFREQNKLTQLQLAEKLGVSDKTISKWETGRGYPDITLLEPIAKVFSLSVSELLSGNTVKNTNISANLLHSDFYICPICGNVIYSVGQSAITCHGIALQPAEAEPSDKKHDICIETSEDEYYIRINHEMTKSHYISFAASVSSDSLQLVKLYPEGKSEVRFKINGQKRIYLYCNQDGLFYTDIVIHQKKRIQL